jgi:hypothetical protein
MLRDGNFFEMLMNAALPTLREASYIPNPSLKLQKYFKLPPLPD